MLHWHSIWKHMRKLTNREIEKRAVWELLSYLEDLIERVIQQCEVELQEQNKRRELQGLYKKARIDGNCVQDAIKTINSKEHSNLP